MEIARSDYEGQAVRMSDEEQLRDLCERHDAYLREIEWREAVMCYYEASRRMQMVPYFDSQLNQEYADANRRLLALFEQGWSLGDPLLSKAYAAFKMRLCYRHRAEG